MTYHDMYKAQFVLIKKIMKTATENYNMAVESKKNALAGGDSAAIEVQSIVQERLNSERECMISRMKRLGELASKGDKTPIPEMTKYRLSGDDDIGIEFKYGKGELVWIETTVKNVFEKSCIIEAESIGDKEEARYVEEGITFVLSFHSDSVIRFMTSRELYENRSTFIGRKCITRVDQKIDKLPIRSMRETDGRLSIDVGEYSVPVDEPTAVTSDNGAIWRRLPETGITPQNNFKWVWFKKG